MLCLASRGREVIPLILEVVFQYEMQRLKPWTAENAQGEKRALRKPHNQAPGAVNAIYGLTNRTSYLLPQSPRLPAEQSRRTRTVLTISCTLQQSGVGKLHVPRSSRGKGCNSKKQRFMRHFQSLVQITSGFAD